MALNRSGNCRAKFNCSKEVKKVLMASFEMLATLDLAEYLILLLLWLMPNKSEGFFLLSHANLPGGGWIG